MFTQVTSRTAKALVTVLDSCKFEQWVLYLGTVGDGYTVPQPTSNNIPQVNARLPSFINAQLHARLGRQILLVVHHRLLYLLID